MDSKLKERYFILVTAYMIFLKYCESKGFMTPLETQQLAKEFSNILLKLCAQHNQTILEKEKAAVPSATSEDFFKLIKLWYKNDEFDLSESQNTDKIKKQEGFINNVK